MKILADDSGKLPLLMAARTDISISLERTTKMKTRILLAVAAVAFLSAGSLRAADLKCPLSGKPVDETKTVEFNGGKVAFCCGNCPKAFSAAPEKFAAKANLQLVQSGQLKQVKCPLTGRPCAPDKSVEVDGVKVGLCCAGCLGKVTKAEGDAKLDLLFKDTKKGFEAASK
ncbi:MAG: hypothetical protein AB7E98_01345 [Pirellulales bacterium]